MLQSEFVIKASDVVIEKADNGLFYLEPMWKSLLINNELNIKNISDIEMSWSDIQDILKLEVEKRNTISSVKPLVLSWLYDVITATVDPVMLNEETDYIKNLTEYLKTKKELEQSK